MLGAIERESEQLAADGACREAADSGPHLGV